MTGFNLFLSPQERFISKLFPAELGSVAELIKSGKAANYANPEHILS